MKGCRGQGNAGLQKGNFRPSWSAMKGCRGQGNAGLRKGKAWPNTVLEEGMLRPRGMKVPHMVWLKGKWWIPIQTRKTKTTAARLRYRLTPGARHSERELSPHYKLIKFESKNKLVLQTVIALPRLPDKEVYAWPPYTLSIRLLGYVKAHWLAKCTDKWN